MYFSSIQEIRDEYPLLIKYLGEKKRTIDFLPVEDVFLITPLNGIGTKKTLEEMQNAENELKSKNQITGLQVMKKIYHNSIKPLWT